MSWVAYLAIALEMVAAALALRIARGSWRAVDVIAARPAHRPVARYLAAVALSEPVRALLRWAVLAPAREGLGPGHPYQGLARWTFHLDQALFFVGPVGLILAAIVTFWGLRAPRIGHILGASALLLAALVVSYPSSPGPYYEAWRGLWWPGVIAGLHGLAQLTAWGSAGLWMRRNPGGWADESSKVVMALACADLALWLAGVLPWRMFTDWHLGDAARAAILAWVCWEQVAWMRSTRAA